MKLIYYLDVLSSWCLIAEEALARIRGEFGGGLAYEWHIAALRHPLNYSPAQLTWYYSRTASVTGRQLNPVWLQSTADGSRWANLAAEASRRLGCTDDRVRLALARETMEQGKRGSQRDVAIDIAAAAGGLDREALARAVDDPATTERIRKSSAEFEAYHVDVRPTFVLRSAIGDTNVLSGCWRYEPLAAAVRALMDDQHGYERFVAAHPGPAGTA